VWTMWNLVHSCFLPIPSCYIKHSKCSTSKWGSSGGASEMEMHGLDLWSMECIGNGGDIPTFEAEEFQRGRDQEGQAKSAASNSSGWTMLNWGCNML
jgi:hypothetical protein